MRRATAAVIWASVVMALGLCGCLDQQMGGVLTLASTTQPDNASLTILLCLVPGPNHVADAEAYKDTVAKATGWRDVYVVHKAQWSELYRGRYLSMPQAQRDLKRTKVWRDARGLLPFAQALVMPLPAEQVGPPEWNLQRTSGVFTVTVAEFYDVPEASYVGRKDFAVQSCRELRSQGLEAYYYHGPLKSFVCIGSFPESSYPSIQEKGTVTRVIRDPRIQTILKRFPFLAVNGRQDLYVVEKDSGKPSRLATASYVMEIPR